ncbi:MAG: CooT family nickel-binding protein [Candidatus Schekmanbacteria bacterium]|nr:CooT family nickel-binding protein [Candidatus Schekmanbacteria bacterium]
MCEANVYITKGEKEELFLEQVDIILPEGDEFFLQNIYGEQKNIKAELKEISLLDHRIVLKPKE